ncbi:mechanosensitive ion channel [Acidaminobacter sp. JC074]|uniref:mechanosensitive ion channel family protein n=1 Tax=Acidaminobacter sp. JC074 TaxID=2530199 RepID=UPI001F10FE06|nr:mechanosensitive ion channel domain-containing protein [Acidaminobacter sp. JC074]MCH4887283.1 mechanosensitive ion channel [Acidaminobacter sp. JC074]
MNNLIETVKGLVVTYGMKVILCLLFLIIGLRVIKSIVKRVEKALDKRDIDKTVAKFAASMTNIVLKILLVIALAGTLGVKETSFVAVLGAAGFAIGMALQGSLGNFAAGVILLILRPIKIGDFVEVAGMTGSVSSIQVFSTELKTPDNKTIIIPNGSIIGSNIINYSVEPQRRVDFTFGVDYDADIKTVKELLVSTAKSHDLVLDDPDVFVGLAELGDSSINFVLRVWVNAPDYWTVFFDLNEQVKEKLDAANIGIPYPHIQVVND